MKNRKETREIVWLAFQEFLPGTFLPETVSEKKDGTVKVDTQGAKEIILTLHVDFSI